MQARLDRMIAEGGGRDMKTHCQSRRRAARDPLRRHSRSRKWRGRPLRRNSRGYHRTGNRDAGSPSQAGVSRSSGGAQSHRQLRAAVIQTENWFGRTRLFESLRTTGASIRHTISFERMHPEDLSSARRSVRNNRNRTSHLLRPACAAQIQWKPPRRSCSFDRHLSDD
jgi:hypothetical protein